MSKSNREKHEDRITQEHIEQLEKENEREPSANKRAIISRIISALSGGKGDE